MGCPMNDIRDFKQARKESNLDNVGQIRREAPVASLHHARAEEADIEVTIETESETLTCEMNTMQTANESNNVEQLRKPLSDLAEGIKEALNTKPEHVEESTMENINVEEQVETVSITDATTRYNTLRRNAIVGNIVGNIGGAIGMVAGAALNGREVKRAACVGGVLGAVSIGWMLTSKRQKAIAKAQADYFDEDLYQVAAENKPSTIAAGFAGALAFGAVLGAVFIRKVATSEE
ncbi:hypothetical protein pEaSNUABM37_00143 [Erwinia phage pEa_SNUABM_37]|nr:hypothetical protein pEaSNUABM37_00143 [Erwinia phage pEa_SNUABM_37]QXO10613.1 hypothetical protein pEaSNUABM48_00143 [Erwinia phage pEa_SNUABM_48]